ncbi:hypothetical protein LguiA_005113 [Lonicera macranthoides]
MAGEDEDDENALEVDSLQSIGVFRSQIRCKQVSCLFSSLYALLKGLLSSMKDFRYLCSMHMILVELVHVNRCYFFCARGKLLMLEEYIFETETSQFKILDAPDPFSVLVILISAIQDHKSYDPNMVSDTFVDASRRPVCGAFKLRRGSMRSTTIIKYSSIHLHSHR